MEQACRKVSLKNYALMRIGKTQLRVINAALDTFQFSPVKHIKTEGISPRNGWVEWWTKKNSEQQKRKKKKSNRNQTAKKKE